MSGRKIWVFRLAAIGLALVALLVLAEFVIGRVLPQHCMYPRYQFSPQYGMLPFPDTAIKHWQPRVFHLTYTTNAKHHRGPLPTVSNAYPKKNIVVLGDSNSFGMGVNDGEEYPRVLGELLADTHDVVNLACPGWGLTQQIRRYYELGQLYRPSVVLLQFCNNDVEENLVNAVTEIQDGRFVFVDSPNTVNWIKKYLSHAPIQKLQLYNLVRNDLYEFFTRGVVEEKRDALETADEPAADAAQQFYIDLLDLLARDFAERGIRLFYLSYDDYLAMFPAIEAKVNALDREGLLERVRPDPWLEGLTDIEAPDGHRWGVEAHRLVASHLADLVRGLD